MDAYEYSELLKLLNTKLNNIKGILKPDDLNKRLDEITQEESAQDFWNNVENATKIGIEKNRILGKLNKFNKAFLKSLHLFLHLPFHKVHLFLLMNHLLY